MNPEVTEHRFEDDGKIPNNANLPLLLYPRALEETDLSPSYVKELLARNGWGGAWVNGVFPTTTTTPPRTRCSRS